MPTTALVVGGGAREHAIATTLATAGARVVSVATHANPGLLKLGPLEAVDPTSPEKVVAVARNRAVRFAVIGPEAPLASGVADALRAAGVPVVGPDRAAARIESSKEFARDLLARHGVPGQPRLARVRSAEEVDAATSITAEPFVVKPVGLTSGKGVWVQGLDFLTAEEGIAYAKRLLLTSGESVLLEERLEGEEFSLMAFVTDSGIYPMPLVQDYKRALEGDRGPNTGGMGSYSQRDHLLPFVPRAAFDGAVEVLTGAVRALASEGLSYRGILYGGFLLTAHGPKLLEFNARFGDPESLNVLTIYEEGDFAELLEGVANGRVDPNLVRFRPRATVVKYLVPPGYGAGPRAGAVVELDAPRVEAAGVRIYFGQAEAAGPGRFVLGSSRGIALVGESSAIHEASSRVETALGSVRGDFYVRHDIATKTELSRRVEHMRGLLAPGAKPSPLPLSVAPADAPASSAATASQTR